MMTPAGDPPQRQRVTIAQAMEIAIECHNNGDLPEARRIYQQILTAEPNNYDALHLLGLAANELGENDQAVVLIKQAIALAPQIEGMHSNLGLVYQDLGQLEKAAECFQASIEINPDFAEGHNNLALAWQDLGQTEAAIEAFHTAIALNPNFPEAHSNIGNAYKLLGHLDAAERSHRKAIDCAPDFAGAHNNLGTILHTKGALTEAVGCFETALKLNPNFADALVNLGAVFQEQENFDDAKGAYRKALSLNPDIAEAHANLGIALMETGDPEGALDCHRKAVALKPDTESFWAGFAATIEAMSFTSVDDNLIDDLLLLLDHTTIDPLSVAPAAISALRTDPEIEGAFEGTGDAGHLETKLLFQRVISLCPIKDLYVEAALTMLRRVHLERTQSNGADKAALPFLAALAGHCFINEYIFRESEEETTAIAELADKIETSMSSKQPLSANQLLVLAAYRPLFQFHWAEFLEPKLFPDDVRLVLEQQIIAPMKEIGLRKNLRSLTGIEDTVSNQVRAQYEENPYPRWTRFAKQHTPANISEVLSNAPLRFELDDYRPPDKPEILIAGCGTGQQILLAASRYRDAQILAVDLSRSSLAYAQRKTDEYGIDCVDYAHADILALDQLSRQFDLIECVGVLHHMADPLAGWQVLVDRLTPGGVMKIGLYSEQARQDVVAARALIAEQGYNADPVGIRQCREHIISSAQEGDELMQRLIGRNSFYTMSEFRDLVFHVQENRFTLPQIEAALKTLKLDFLGFEMKDQATIRQFKNTTTANLASLPDWHQFECQNPETFAGMYQFWVRKR